MFAIKYYFDFGHAFDFKIFETVGAALKWWTEHARQNQGNADFYERLFVVPPGLDDPVKWCKDNIKEVA